MREGEGLMRVLKECDAMVKKQNYDTRVLNSINSFFA